MLVYKSIAFQFIVNESLCDILTLFVVVERGENSLVKTTAA